MDIQKKKKKKKKFNWKPLISNPCPSLSPRIRKMENLVMWQSRFSEKSVTGKNNASAGRSKNIVLTRDQVLAGLESAEMSFTGKFF